MNSTSRGVEPRRFWPVKLGKHLTRNAKEVATNKIWESQNARIYVERTLTLALNRSCRRPYYSNRSTSVIDYQTGNYVYTRLWFHVKRSEMHVRRFRRFIVAVDSGKILQLAAPGFRI
jgi:hypothetical protein